MKLLLLAGLLIAALIFAAQGSSWSGYVKTDADSWSISRESSNLSFTMDQSIEGQVSSVDYRGRTLSPYHSYYKDLSLNDVKVKERTAALDGSISSEESLTMQSWNNKSVNATIYKPSGSDTYTVEFYEKWPVELSDSENITYSGKQINSRGFVGNNRDYAGSNFLYSQDFSKEQSLNVKLERLNATIFASDEEIESADVMATKSTQYRLQSHSTGIAAIKFQQENEDGSVIGEGDQRYNGIYDIDLNLQMNSRYDLTREQDDWLPCCSGGYSDMKSSDQKPFKSAKGIFDCTCYEVPRSS